MTSRQAELEQAILAIFAQALGQEINAEADFFAMGGDSLAAEHVLAELSARLGSNLPGWVLLDHPTAAGLAAVLSD
jgi:hypothetical protein